MSGGSDPFPPPPHPPPPPPTPCAATRVTHTHTPRLSLSLSRPRVTRLEVAVHDARRVHVREPGRHVGRQPPKVVRRAWSVGREDKTTWRRRVRNWVAVFNPSRRSCNRQKSARSRPPRRASPAAARVRRSNRPPRGGGRARRNGGVSLSGVTAPKKILPYATRPLSRRITRFKRIGRMGLALLSLARSGFGIETEETVTPRGEGRPPYGTRHRDRGAAG